MKVFMGTLLALTTTLGARRFFLRFRPDGLDNQGVYAPAREIFRLLRFRGRSLSRITNCGISVHRASAHSRAYELTENVRGRSYHTSGSRHRTNAPSTKCSSPTSSYTLFPLGIQVPSFGISIGRVALRFALHMPRT